MYLFETIIYCILLQVIKGQVQINLAVNQQPINLYIAPYINPRFTIVNNFLACSSNLYYYAQSNTEYELNTPNQILITNNSLILNLSVSTQYNRFQPVLNNTQCSSSSCIIAIQYNCAFPLTNDNYFDIISVTILPIGVFSYYLNCNISYNTTYFEYGGLILICLATLILTVATYLGRWNSFSGFGIEYGYKMIVLVSSSILTVGLLSLYNPNAAAIVLDIGNTFSIIASVSVISIEGLYFLKIPCIQQKYYIKKFPIRIIDVLGVLISIAVTIGWWLSGLNWIFSDILSIFFIVSVIKVFKFVSFKVALIAYLVMVTMYSASDIIIATRYQNQTSHFYLYQTVTPYQFQIPRIRPAFVQKCTWVSITTIAFPGLLVSYLRRFDQSRSTRIYLITALTTYFLGSVIWWIVSTFSYYSLPFDAFCEPIMIIAFTLFAFKRKELRTLWEGKFYDEEFQNQNEIDIIGQKIADQKTNEIPLEHFKDIRLNEILLLKLKEDSELENNQHTIYASDINNDQL